MEGVERELQSRLGDQQEPTVSLHLDKTVNVDCLTKLMNIGKRNNYKMILATSPE